MKFTFWQLLMLRLRGIKVTNLKLSSVSFDDLKGQIK